MVLSVALNYSASCKSFRHYYCREDIHNAWKDLESIFYWVLDKNALFVCNLTLTYLQTRIFHDINPNKARFGMHTCAILDSQSRMNFKSHNLKLKGTKRLFPSFSRKLHISNIIMPTIQLHLIIFSSRHPWMHAESELFAVNNRNWAI